MYINSLYIYTLIFSIGLFFSTTLKGRLWFLSIIFMTFSFGLREFIGNDWNQYVNIYRVIGEYQTKIMIEPGAYIINYISSLLHLEYGYYIVFCVYSLLTLTFTYKGLSYYNCEKWFVPVLFLTGFVFFANNAIRQALAISYLLYSSRYIYTNRKKYIIMMMFSTVFFHYSSALNLFLIFVPKRDFGRFFYFNFFIVSFVFNKLAVVKYILLSIISYVPYYGAIYLERVEGFTSQEKGVGLVVLLWYLIVGFCIFHKDKLRYEIFNIFIFGSLVCLAGIQVEMWERVMIPYFYFNIIFLAVLLSNTILKDWLNLVLSFCLILTLTSLTIYQILNDVNKNKVSPYYHYILNKASNEP